MAWVGDVYGTGCSDREGGRIAVAARLFCLHACIQLAPTSRHRPRINDVQCELIRVGVKFLSTLNLEADPVVYALQANQSSLPDE